MSVLHVPVMVFAHGEGLPLPFAASAGAAGLDLSAAIDAPLELPAMARALVPTGLAIAIPQGFEGQVRPRSGLAWTHGVTILNAPGTIDSDYRGEIKVQLINLGHLAHTIQRGDRIAQLVIAPVTAARLEIAPALSATERGAGGFGSTGISGPKVESRGAAVTC